MKLSVHKSFSRKVMIFAVCVITLLGSCDDDNGNPCANNGEGSAASGKSELSLESFNAHDLGNEGNASDIFVTCQLSGTLDRFEKLRFILKVSSSEVKLGKALTARQSSYVESDVAQNVEVTFPAGLTDADGAPIAEGKSYTIYILGVPSPCSGGAPVLLRGPGTITLKDEIIVTTPKLKGTLSADEDISIDEDYNLFISGGAHNPSSLFKVAADGTVTTLSTTLSYPVGNTLDENGNLYVTNFNSLDINYVTSAGVTSVFISDEKLFRGGGIIQDNDGALYNTFWAIKTLYKITATGVEDYLTSNILNGPVGIAYDEVNDHIFVGNFNDGKILRITRDKNVEVVAQVPGNIGHLDYRDGVFYATAWGQHKVFVVSTDGEILATIGNGNQATVDGPASEASFFSPNGIAVSKDGKYLFISQGDGTLRKIVL